MSRILVIEDDSDTRMWLRDLLVFSGHQVVLASNGAEGVKHYLANPFDLVVTDLFMRHQEGLETIQQLRQASSNVRIVAMSGDASAQFMLKAAGKLGAMATLQKPFLPEQFLATIEKVLGIANPAHSAR